MTTAVLERSQACSNTGDLEKEQREDLRRRGVQVILQRLKSALREQGVETSCEEQEREGESIAFVLPDPAFHYEIIYPVELWNKLWDFSFGESADEEEEEEERFEFLHDCALDDLSVDYHTAKEFDEYIEWIKRHGTE